MCGAHTSFGAAAARVWRCWYFLRLAERLGRPGSPSVASYDSSKLLRCLEEHTPQVVSLADRSSEGVHPCPVTSPRLPFSAI